MKKTVPFSARPAQRILCALLAVLLLAGLLASCGSSVNSSGSESAAPDGRQTETVNTVNPVNTINEETQLLPEETKPAETKPAETETRRTGPMIQVMPGNEKFEEKKTLADTLDALFETEPTVKEVNETRVCREIPNLHFPDFVYVDGVLYAYYIKWVDGKGTTALATSTDGVHFSDKGVVIPSDRDYDDVYACFAGVWYEDGVFYLVYECCGTNNPSQDIALATSTDGYTFEKKGIILDQKDCPSFCAGNVGTPDLFRDEGVWYLFFHGFDGVDCQIGVAYGTDLYNLTVKKDPIIPTSSDHSAPDSGTAGRRDVIYYDGWFYMVYEGSTEKVGADYSQSSWTHLYARSADLLNWDKAEQMPAAQGKGFGYDGPCFLVWEDSIYVYYRRPGNSTWRTELVIGD
ncbi:MAG: hypothetical protein IJU20_08875 [Clostridia bacterium]|nr:hypothetical protein [Clostridia bacterium]